MAAATGPEVMASGYILLDHLEEDFIEYSAGYFSCLDASTVATFTVLVVVVSSSVVGPGRGRDLGHGSVLRVLFHQSLLTYETGQYNRIGGLPPAPHSIAPARAYAAHPAA